MVEVGRRIERSQKIIGADRGHRSVAFGEEIIAVIRIRIANAASGGLIGPRHGPLGIEQMLVTNHAAGHLDRKSTRLNSSHANISYAVFCLKKKKSYTPAPTTSLTPS